MSYVRALESKQDPSHPAAQLISYMTLDQMNLVARTFDFWVHIGDTANG